MIAGAPRKRAETRARDLLDLLGLADKTKDAPGVLSGGQRQRLAIARALANEPTLLLADEPTGALDSEGGREVLELFRRLHADGQTILLVTHDDEVAAAGDRIVRMRDGRIVTPEEEALAGATGTVTPWRNSLCGRFGIAFGPTSARTGVPSSVSDSSSASRAAPCWVPSPARDGRLPRTHGFSTRRTPATCWSTPTRPTGHRCPTSRRWRASPRCATRRW